MPSKKPRKQPAHLVPSEERRSVGEVLRATRQVLDTVKQGLEDIKGPDPGRRLPGLHNVAVFGRSVTIGLQRLRNIVPDFEEWYEASVPTKDPLLNYFRDLRNEILKEVNLPKVSTNATIDYFSGNPAEMLGAPPPGWKGTFIGEAGTGGSGWIVQLPDGTEAKYYVALPPSFQGRVTTHLPDAPTEHLGKPLPDSTVATLAQHYVGFLDRLVAEAEHRFNPREPR